MEVVVVAGRSKAKSTRRQKEEVQVCYEAGTLEISCTHSVPVTCDFALPKTSPAWDAGCNNIPMSITRRTRSKRN